MYVSCPRNKEIIVNSSCSLSGTLLREVKDARIRASFVSARGLKPRAVPNPSEVHDKVGGADECRALVGGDSRVGIAVEGGGVHGVIDRHFRTKLDLRRAPVLPAHPRIGIASLRAGTLALHVVIPFKPKREIVQLVGR